MMILDRDGSLSEYPVCRSTINTRARLELKRIFSWLMAPLGVCCAPSNLVTSQPATAQPILAVGSR